MSGRAPALRGVERVRLWLSYQRYALLLGLGPPIACGLLVLAMPARWYVWGPAALVCLPLLAAARHIAARMPRKIRATLAADRRIAQGRFDPVFVRPYCSDPCFRVVAREILRRAHVPRSQRPILIRRFREEKEREGEFVLFVDRTQGVHIRVGENGAIERFPPS